MNSKNLHKESQEPAAEYTYPQLLVPTPATRPGSILDRQGGSIFNRRRQTDAFDIDFEHPHTGFEALVVKEMTVDSLWRFLNELRSSGDNGSFAIPADRPTDIEIQKLTKSALKASKGVGWAARLFEGCGVAELPVSVTSFLEKVYAAFPKQIEVSLEDSAKVVLDGALPLSKEIA